MDEGTKRKILRNTLVMVASRLCLLVVGFLLTPYILSRLGDEVFGLWALTIALVSFAGIADLGFGTSFVKFVAEYDAKREPEKINGVLTIGVLMFAVMGTLVLLAVWPFRDSVLQLVGVTDNLLSDARYVLSVTLVVWVVMNLVGVYRSIIDGLQRMEISAAIMLVSGFFYAIGVIGFLEAGWGIRGLALNQLLLMAVRGVLSVFFAYRLQPGLRFDIEGAAQQFRPLFNFSLNLQASRIALMVNAQFDKVLISTVLGPAHVTTYDLGNRLTNVAKTVPEMFLHALLPAASEMITKGALDDAYNLYSRASKYVALVALLLVVGVGALAGPIMHLWIGPGYAMSAQVVMILAVGALFRALSGPVSPVVQGLGKPEVQRNAELLNLVLNVTLSTVLIVHLGVLGAAIGTTCALVFSSSYYLLIFHRIVMKSLPKFLHTVLFKPVMCAVAAGLISHLIALQFSDFIQEGRLHALAVCALAGAVFLGTFATLCVLSKVFDDQELMRGRHLLASVWRRGARSEA
jgi:O-antigen/teichoic acid export membrane protein